MSKSIEIDQKPESSAAVLEFMSSEADLHVELQRLDPQRRSTGTNVKPAFTGPNPVLW